jgi:hypothetical protein
MAAAVVFCFGYVHHLEKNITTAGIHIYPSKPRVHLNNILTYWLKARNVEREKQPLPGNARTQQ